MDHSVLLNKIASLKRCVERIESKLPLDLRSIESDFDTQDIIVLNLQRAVQVSVDAASHVLARLDVTPPQTMSECFVRLLEAGVLSERIAVRMQKSVGFRNIVVHEYQAIDWNVVLEIITHHLSDFREYAGELLVWLDNGR